MNAQLRLRLLLYAAALTSASQGAVSGQAATISNPTVHVTETQIQWSAVPGATHYDIVRGDLNALRQSGGDFRAATRSCLPHQWTFVGGTDIGYVGVPTVGEGFWFLVRGASSTEVGSYDSGGLAQAGTRDPEIEAAPSACISPILVHDPIVIVGDAEFTPANGVVGGSGTAADPWEIAGWEISCFGGGAGIRVAGTTDPFVIRDVFVADCQDGILLDSAPNGRVDRSWSYYNGTGVRLLSGGDATMEGNLIEGSQPGPGVGVFGATGIRIQGNVIRDGATGIFLDGAASCVVHANNLKSNGVQAIDTGGGPSAWNEPYPGGGNYWSDHTGSDLCRGPEQDDCAFPDGYADSPYVLGPGAADAYPLQAEILQDWDTMLPSAQIQAPADGASPGITPVGVSGTASDIGRGVQRVEVRANDGAWTTAVGATSWNASLPLVSGHNQIEARAIDHEGHVSTAHAIGVVYLPECAGRTGGAVIAFDFPSYSDSETLRVWITSDPFIDTAQQFLDTGSTTMVPGFRTLLDGRDCDPLWTWHPDPLDVGWAPTAIELCDGLPGGVEADKTYWFQIGFCPWSARVIAVDDFR